MSPNVRPLPVWSINGELLNDSSRVCPALEGETGSSAEHDSRRTPESAQTKRSRGGTTDKVGLELYCPHAQSEMKPGLN